MEPERKPPASVSEDEHQWHEYFLYQQRMKFFRKKLADGKRLNRRQQAVFDGPVPPKPARTLGNEKEP